MASRCCWCRLLRHLARRREQVLELARSLASGSLGVWRCSWAPWPITGRPPLQAVVLPALPPAVPLPAIPCSGPGQWLPLAHGGPRAGTGAGIHHSPRFGGPAQGSTSLREQAELLEQLQLRLGAAAQLQAPDQALPVPVAQMVEAVYRRSLEAGDWEPVRRCAGLLGLVHPHLEDALDDLLARNRQLVVGRNYTSRSRISEPRQRRHRPADAPVQRGRQPRDDPAAGVVAGARGFGSPTPALLQGTLTFQLGQLLLLLTSELASERKLGSAKPLKPCALCPHGIFRRLGVVLADLTRARAALQRCEQLHLRGQRMASPRAGGGKPTGGCWLQHRVRRGGVAVGAAQFLSRCVGAAAALPRAVDWRQVGAPQPPRQRLAGRENAR